MSLHRTAVRRDGNEAKLVKALRAVGADVRRLSGAQVPDLLVGFNGRTYLLGVKAPVGPRGGDKALRAKSGDQKPENWPGGPWKVVTTVEEAIRAIGIKGGVVVDKASAPPPKARAAPAAKEAAAPRRRVPRREPEAEEEQQPGNGHDQEATAADQAAP